MKLIHHKLENGTNDPIEIDFSGMADLYKHVDDWSNYPKDDRVYLATFSSENDDNDGSNEIIVTADITVVFDFVESMVPYTWMDALHIQEFTNFQQAYEVAFYIREGHPLAYPKEADLQS